MKTAKNLSLLLLALCLCGASPEQIDKLKSEYGAESIAIYFDPAQGEIFKMNENEIFHAASTMKVPVMMEVFRQLQQGKWKLDQQVEVKNSFASIMDGSSYSLTPEEDSDQEIYKFIGETMTLRELVERMINQSSNLATNIVIEKVQPARVMDLMKQIGANNMNVLRGVEDLKAYEAGKNNTTDAESLAACYRAILDPNLFSEESRKAMLDILLSQHFQEQIGSGIRAKERGLKVASKSGWITEINHDSAIIEDAQGRRSILVILTRGVKDQKKGEELVAALAAAVWQAHQ